MLWCRYYYYPHTTYGKIEAQRVNPSAQGSMGRFEPRKLAGRVELLNHYVLLSSRLEWGAETRASYIIFQTQCKMNMQSPL